LLHINEVKSVEINYTGIYCQPITGEIYSVTSNWEDYDNVKYELDKNLTDEEVFRQFFSPGEEIYEEM